MPSSMNIVLVVGSSRPAAHCRSAARSVGIPAPRGAAANPALRPARVQRDASLLPQVQRVYEQNLRVYGADKVWRQLKREGKAVARCTVERLIRVNAIRGVSQPQCFVVTRQRDQRQLPALDLVKREFKADSPNQLWVADMTYVPTWAGFIYLAIVLDVRSRSVVGWAIDEQMTTELVLTELNVALQQRRLDGCRRE